MASRKSSGRSSSKSRSRSSSSSSGRSNSGSRSASSGRSSSGKSKSRRTTHRSSSGKKLYAVRSEDGSFKDIQQFSRAHGQDVRRMSQDEAESRASGRSRRRRSSGR
jgi:hypothetical protein